MDMRNKWTVHTVRTLLALFLLFAGVGGMMQLFSGSTEPLPNETPALRMAFDGLMVSGIFLLAKVMEIVIGILLIANFRPALGTAMLAPISIGIMVMAVALEWPPTATIIPGLLVFVLNIYLAYVYWEKYKPIFQK